MATRCPAASRRGDASVPGRTRGIAYASRSSHVEQDDIAVLPASAATIRTRPANGGPMRLANRAALITGGNSGIGLATARLLAAEGARVAITGRNERTLAQAAASIGADVVTARLDVADLAAIEPVVATLAERLGRLDAVFANAGIGGETPVGSTPIALFEQILRV